jgi:dihydroflavonol-4-reductase
MKVLVTGGTGFVGAHSVAALEREGHQVRLLARDVGRVASSLAPLDVGDVEHVIGDARDQAAVEAALAGCDAVLHCASVFTWDPKRQHDLVTMNTQMTEVVLSAAASAGLDPIVHVSSYVALDTTGGPLREDSAVRSVVPGYSGSKASSEVVARRLQGSGAPVVTTYPGAVLGPHDPYLGESNRLVRMLASSRWPPAIGRLSCVDVRDVAAIHAQLIEPGLGPRRFLATGHDLTSADLARLVGAAAGTRIHPTPVPRPMARAAGWVLDLVGTRTSTTPDGGSGAIDLLLEHPGTDSRLAQDQLGVVYRPLEDTLRDTVAWLREQGHLGGRATAEPLQPI